MVNNDRIVPIQKIDFLSMIGIVLNIAEVEYDVLEAKTVEGDFEVTATGIKLANQPVKTLDIASGVATATVYFVPSFDYEGFKVAGVEATYADGSAEVHADGITLYKAVLATGEITITAVAPVVE